MINVDNIRTTVEMIERESGPKKQFNMGDWGRSLGDKTEDPAECGTRMCFAGWAVLAAGGALHAYSYERRDRIIYYTNFVDPEGKPCSAADFAEEWLGLPNDLIFFKAGITDVHELRVALKEMYEVDV